ncbi:NUDIX domain-containing protein [Candidatus Gottesmanbacteria bacterium]|nr:NUDIX domain-containing protein [Candidatus Gottesmanbacteria bacterium]
MKVKRNIAVTLECFIRKGDKYLMLHRNSNKRIMPGVWMAPGGHREFNEGLFECARREVFEETGLKIKNLRIIATGNAYLKDLDEEIFFHFITANYAGGRLKQKIDDGEFVWLTKNRILKQKNLLAELKHVLPIVLDGSREIISFKAAYSKENKLEYFSIEES